ncbi:MAG TPA: isoprenylcysteine carboxylmethyltransferase family protein [Bauldia sp.]|nr:isoprenylcysteine carboxylmethyltransferase family protein [Bauldia sp.]
MRLSSAALGSIVFFIVTPGIVAGAMPLWISGARFHAPFQGYPMMQAAGAILIAGGVVSLVASFARFVWEGRGTPAPIAPTDALVIGGQYRYVRNPMYVAVLAIIVGQALLFASIPTLVYAAAIFALVHTFVVAYEEPTLLDTYGDAYRAYTARVPRWLPRIPRR